MSRQEKAMMTWCQGMIVVDSWYNAPRDHSNRPVVLSQIANSTTAGGSEPDHPAEAATPTMLYALFEGRIHGEKDGGFRLSAVPVSRLPAQDESVQIRFANALIVISHLREG